MPELPEVETVRRHLASRVPGKTVRSVWTSGLALRKPLARGFRGSFAGGRFTGVRRIGKFLFLDWESAEGRSDRSLLAHLGMTGQFLDSRQAFRERPRHTHVVWTFADGSELLFADPRRFGLLEWVARDVRPANVGADPTEFALSGEWLAAELAKSKAPVKAFLLDQRKLAGVGNIYACEALFKAGISPKRRARTLSREEAQRLAEAVDSTLQEAIGNRGTTISNYRDLDDRPGEYGERLLVYGREGGACVRCGNPIRRIVQSGRSSFFCATCQRKPAGARARRDARRAGSGV
jgi:formamidopyrimidine-DNA glycosylase